MVNYNYFNFICIIFTISITSSLKVIKSQIKSKLTVCNAAFDSRQKLIDIADGVTLQDDVFACPETLSVLRKSSRIFGFYQETTYGNYESGVTYKVLPQYIDFTIKVEVNKPIWSLTRSEFFGQNFFQNPVLSAVYERGYRQSFVRAGFPGIDLEFKEASDFFMEGKNKEMLKILDLSCGSGFMTRRFVLEGYGTVFGADLSPTMLLETFRNCLRENITPLPTLVRCDSAKLPFQSSSLDGIHAGAAMHCWPRVRQTLEEVYRTLKPGGTFFATTFFTNSSFSPRGNTPFNFFENEADLMARMESAGFTKSTTEGGYLCVRREGGGCAIIKARKPLIHTTTMDIEPAAVFDSKSVDVSVSNKISADEETSETKTIDSFENNE